MIFGLLRLMLLGTRCGTKLTVEQAAMLRRLLFRLVMVVTL